MDESHDRAAERDEPDAAPRVADEALPSAKRALLERWLATGAPPAGAAAPRRSIARAGGPPRVSAVQRRFWFAEQLEPGTAAHTLSRATWLSGPIDAGALARAVDALARRHETLRTTFAAVDGAPAPIVHDAPLAGLRMLPEDGGAIGEAATLELATAIVREGFDLERGPLARVALIATGPERHLLVFAVHHIVADGSSLGVALGELAALYAALAEGREPALAPLPVQYGDWAAWEHERGATGGWDAGLAYWRERLGRRSRAQLPLDRPRPASLTGPARTLPVALPAPLSDDVRMLARAHDATPFMVLATALATVLARVAGEPSVVLGTAVANRGAPGVGGLIGAFVNTLPLRFDLAGDPTFGDALARVREACLSGYAHQDVPFERLVEELRPERDLGRNPLFDALLVVQNFRLPELRLGAARAEPVALERGRSALDLSLELWEAGGEIAGTLEFRSDLIDPDSARRLVERFETVLAAGVADPGCRLGDLPLASAAELELTERWGTGRSVAVPERRLDDLISESARRGPDRVAAVAGGERVTYAELEARAAALAGRLRALGVGPDVRVGVCVERSVGLVVALLGVLKAGGAYVPLDPSYPVERLRFMLEDSGAVAVVCDDASAGLVAGAGPVVVDVDAGGDPAEAAPPIGRPDDLAYVIYTSGSTGRPKGVAVEHRSVVNLLHDLRDRLSLTEDDVFPALSPASFDISVVEIFLPLACGFRVVLASAAETIDGQRLAAFVERARPTVMLATPTLWRLLLEGGWDAGDGLRAIAGGETLDASLAERIAATGATPWNGYGPTEATVATTIGELTLDGRPPPLGEPIANTYVRVVDERGRPAPIGAAGELWIGGVPLARGYVDRPGLTAERFVPDPRGAPGARLYRSGDRVRWRADGGLEHLGRLDDQVKLRGHRIELGEVDAQLARHPAVRAAATVIAAGGGGEPRLVAYVVLADDATEGLDDPGSAAARERRAVGEIRRALKASLPPYMVPSAFVPVASLPRTPSGKLDRTALAGVPALAIADAPHVAPRDAREETVARIWRELLEVERVGVDDDFFELGGHSLLAMRAAARIAAELGVAIDVRTIFERRTVAAICATLADAPAGEPAPAVPPPLERVERRPYAPRGTAAR